MISQSKILIALAVMTLSLGVGAPALAGSPLRAIVKSSVRNPGTVIGGYNEAISNLKVTKNDQGISVQFDMNASKSSAPIKMLNFTPKMAFILFDENENELTRFITSDYYTANVGLAYALKENYELQGKKIISVKEVRNKFFYKVNRRDLRDTAIVVVTFYD